MTELPVLPTDAPESWALLVLVNADPDEPGALRPSKARFFLIDPLVPVVLKVP